MTPEQYQEVNDLRICLQHLTKFVKAFTSAEAALASIDAVAALAQQAEVERIAIDEKRGTCAAESDYIDRLKASLVAEKAVLVEELASIAKEIAEAELAHADTMQGYAVQEQEAQARLQQAKDEFTKFVSSLGR